MGVAGGGHQAAVSPLSLITQWSHHFLYDVSPYIACCLPLSLDCLTFYSERPSDNCRHFSPWRPGRVIVKEDDKQACDRCLAADNFFSFTFNLL